MNYELLETQINLIITEFELLKRALEKKEKKYDKVAVFNFGALQLHIEQFDKYLREYCKENGVFK